MFLSDIIKDMNLDLKFKLINETEFETLALIDSDIDKKYCSFLDNIQYKNKFGKNITMIITSKKFADKIPSHYGVCVLDNPRLFFFKMHNYLSYSNQYVRKNFDTIIGENCRISKFAEIKENNVVIGNDVVVEEFCIIHENVIIKDKTVIRSGSVIGGTGFEFKHDKNGVLSISHTGGVKIGRNVEIQHNCCVDRAIYPWDNTEIGDNTKIGSLSVIAHGAKVRNDVMIAPKVAIGGRTVLERGVWVGLNACIMNGLFIGENSRVNIGAVVIDDLSQNESVSGNFAIDNRKAILEHFFRKRE